jgi:hypothetical protein
MFAMVARAMELTPIARMIASSAREGAPQPRHQAGFYYGRETFPNEGAEKAGVTGQMWLGIISSATMLFLAAPAFADACLFQPRRPFQLSSDTVEWSMLIASGRTCTQGLRFGSINITSVKLIAPPQSGKVDIKGPSFSYAAKADFQGQDQFTIQVSGTVVRIAGVSDVKVTVSVVDK